MVRVTSFQKIFMVVRENLTIVKYSIPKADDVSSALFLFYREKTKAMPQ